MIGVALAIWGAGAIWQAVQFGWHLDIEKQTAGPQMVIACVGWPFIFIASVAYAVRSLR